MHDPDATLRRRLAYASHRRGTKELDLVLGPFAEAHLEGLRGAELLRFAALLDAPEPDLYAWICGQPAPAEHETAVLAAIRRFAAAGRRP